MTAPGTTPPGTALAALALLSSPPVQTMGKKW
jgi:hypothetical protein